MNPNSIRLISGAASLLSNEPVILFTASSYDPTYYTYITISWNVSNASSVSIDNGIGTVAATGNASVNGGYYELKTFTLTAIGLDMSSYTSTFSVRWSCNGAVWRDRCYN